MGLTTGAVIDMIKISPLGDPVEYRLRGYHLSLRKSEARTIEVELVDKLIPSAGHFSESILPLGLCKSGQKVEISKTRGGRRIGRKIMDLGLNPGAIIYVVSNDFPGPLIISTNDENRLIIGRGMSMHIQVKPSSA